MPYEEFKSLVDIISGVIWTGVGTSTLILVSGLLWKNWQDIIDKTYDKIKKESGDLNQQTINYDTISRDEIFGLDYVLENLDRQMELLNI